MSPTLGWWLAVLGAAGAAALALPVRPSSGTAPVATADRSASSSRWHLPAALLAGVAAGLVVGGPVAPVAGVAAAVAAWWVLDRAEPPEARRRRERVRRDLPHVVSLLASALRAGAAPGEAVTVVAQALPGPAADRLAPVAARLALGVDPVEVWEALATDPELAPLGRALARAQGTGGSVVRSVERLADELGEHARGDVEDRARAVGVKAAVPLGLCLLPAFVLVGIVPLVAALLESLDL
ncbi:MAG: type II secretion system F family protein [Nocardioides sp.]